MQETRLSPEEEFIWVCARRWRAALPPVAATELDWARLVAIARFNRMEPLLVRLLAGWGMLADLPPPDAASLQAESAKSARRAQVMADSLQEFLGAAAERGIEIVVLKGLSLSVNLYGDAALRPGGDIDLLVRVRDVAGSLDLLESRNIGRFWPNLMDDRYYSRHHLHQQRCSADLKLWYEVHWALDHPLTRLTIDYEAMMDRATSGTLLGAPVRELSWADNMMALSVHLVKHAVYLPAALGREDLARVILADGALMNFLDVALLVRSGADGADWDALVCLCRESGTAEMVGSVLTVCRRLLEAPVPAWVTEALPVKKPGTVRRLVMDRLIRSQVARHLGEGDSRLWRFLLVTNGAFILRPIRLLDLAAYLLPGRDYLQRRYGSAGLGKAISHLFFGLGRYLRLVVDTLGFMWERHWRLRRLNFNTSLFNRLDVEA